MSGVFNIRPFDLLQDYEIVCDLWDNAGPGLHLGRSDGHEEIAKKLERDPDLFLVAENNQQIIGAVLGGFDGRRGIVYHLAVQGEYRNSGVGSGLMEALEERLRLKGCLRYYLLVTKDNKEAMKFYEKRGWKRLELFVYGKDLIVKE
jgi:ribosomal protein S18 acetylase RimI-like enzyme